MSIKIKKKIPKTKYKKNKHYLYINKTDFKD